MATFLYRVGAFAYRRRWIVILAWLALIGVVGATAVSLATAPSNTFSIPGMDSERAKNLLSERFPDEPDLMNSAGAAIVLQAPEGRTLADPAYAGVLRDTVGRLRGMEQLPREAAEQIADPVSVDAGVRDELAQGAIGRAMQSGRQLTPEQARAATAADAAAVSPLSSDKRTGLISVTFPDIGPADLTQASRDAISAAVRTARDGGLNAEVGGSFAAPQGPGGVAELIGLGLAAIVLIVMFGALASALYPLITAIVGVGIGIMALFAATGVTDTVNESSPALASMLGLAVGIDYALFILSRYRHEITLTDDRAHAVGRAVGTAGTAVVFAGSTVVIALLALRVINIPFLTTMAFGAAFTVLLAVLIAVTLLPAVLGVVGARAFVGRLRFVKAPDPEGEAPTMGLKWARLIRGRPALFVIVPVLVLAVLALPVAQLRLALPTAATADPATTERKAHDMIDESFGPGRNAPMIAVVDAADVAPEARMQAFGAVTERIAGVDGVAHAQIVGLNREQGRGDVADTAKVLITPTTGTIDRRTHDTLVALRGIQGSVHDETGASYGVTGTTAIETDVSDRLQGALIPYLGIVIALAFLILILVFRSLLVPLIATLGFGLSVAATFGATVAIFQEGRLGLVSNPQPIIGFLPILLIGVVFGLAMDYQVFLVTRMREGYVHGKTAGNATANGFKHGARVVTAAATIMIGVFLGFLLEDQIFVTMMGFALAAAVFFDAFIIRMTLIPATMYLLDDRAWWLPRWLDRIVPKVDVEGESLAKLAPADARAEAVPATPGGGTEAVEENRP